jgi:hypothetical protein
MTCRNAARAASFGDPDDATARAQAVLDRSGERGDAAIVSNSVLVSPVEVHVTSEPVTQRDENSRKEFTPGGQVSGTVTAITEVDVSPFVLHVFLGKGRKLTFRSQQTFPITYAIPATRPTS